MPIAGRAKLPNRSHKSTGAFCSSSIGHQAVINRPAQSLKIVLAGASPHLGVVLER